MTTKDLKTEIQKALEQVPETALTEVLAYLHEIRNREPGSISNPVNLAKILGEDKDVLKKLAQ